MAQGADILFLLYPVPPTCPAKRRLPATAGRRLLSSYRPVFSATASSLLYLSKKRHT